MKTTKYKDAITLVAQATMMGEKVEEKDMAKAIETLDELLFNYTQAANAFKEIEAKLGHYSEYYKETLNETNDNQSTRL